MRQAQHASFNTLDNWGHKTPTQSKKRKDTKEKVKGSWAGTHTIHTVTLMIIIIVTPLPNTGTQSMLIYKDYMP